MQVKCDCGKTLNVPDTLAGKSARCPGCSKVFKVPGAAAAAAPMGKLQFECGCGKKLSAPVSAAGRKIACPGCSKELIVPKPAGGAGASAAKPASKPAAPPPKAAGDDDLSLDDAPPPADPPKAAPPAEPEPAKEEGGMYGVATTKCPSCKAELEAGSQFCTGCGTNISTGTKVNGAVAQAAPAKAAGKAGFMDKIKGILAGLKKKKK
jgi:hypothetical protein